MELYAGADTSNYTTSAAVYDLPAGRIMHAKQLLPVKEGAKGIRQSDAVFHHTQQLPSVVASVTESVKKTYEELSFTAFGASTQPRRTADSYMPCFLVGTANMGNAAAWTGLPFYAFSHQEGHVAAALYSADRLDLVGQKFLAFHVSGGTTESLLITPGENTPLLAERIGTSTDLKAGMAIDRVGLMLGLTFPCGPALEQLALRSEKIYKIRPLVKGFDCSLSGVENKCRQMIDRGEAPEDVALFCLKYIEATLSQMTEHLLEEYPGLPLVFSGGVMSNSIIRQDFQREYGAAFAAPEFSADNAAGVAILTAYAHRAGCPAADPVEICKARKH